MTQWGGHPTSSSCLCLITVELYPTLVLFLWLHLDLVSTWNSSIKETWQPLAVKTTQWVLIPTSILPELSLSCIHLESETVSRSVMSLCNTMDCSLLLLCPWEYPGKNTGLGCHFLLPRIFTTQGSVLGPYQISLSTIPLFSSLLICQPVFTSSPLHWSRGPSLNFLLHSQHFYLVDIIFALTRHNCSASWFQPTWFLLSSSQTSEHGKKPSYSSADWSHCWWIQGQWLWW